MSDLISDVGPHLAMTDLTGNYICNAMFYNNLIFGVFVFVLIISKKVLHAKRLKKGGRRGYSDPGWRFSFSPAKKLFSSHFQIA